MTHGTGTLFFATRSGVKVARVRARALDAPPAAVWWPHFEGCAWTAAWLAARGRGMIGPRQILLRAEWRGDLVWRERGETRKRGHRPDLAGCLPSGDTLPIEVELSEKSPARLKAVLGLHACWVRERRAGGVIYVCGTPDVAGRVRAAAGEAGFSEVAGTIRIELLDTIRAEATRARAGRDSEEAA